MPILADLPTSQKSGWPWQAPEPRFDRQIRWPRISIVTPSYNQGPYLEETIRSVLLQGYPDLEYFIMDGGSTDGSRAILERYSSFLSGWVSERDQGQTDAINKGFARSTGAIMGWLNSDDILLPGALKRIASAFLRDPATNVVCGLRRLIDAETHFVSNWITQLPVKYVLERVSVVAQETTYWRREVYEKIGPLDISYRFAMDYEYWQRMLAAGYRFRFIPQFLGGFRKHEESKTSTLTLVRNQELERIYAKYLGRQISHDEIRHEVSTERDSRFPVFKRHHMEKLRDMPLMVLRLNLIKLLARKRLS